MIDLLPYLRGDGRQYTLVNDWNQPPELVRTDRVGLDFFTVKNRQFEHLYHDSAYIYRGLDTSPGGDRVYIQQTGAVYGAAWARRHMRVGDLFKRAPRLIWRAKNDGRILNTQDVRDYLRLVDHHPTWLTFTGTSLPDVIELAWQTGPDAAPLERYFYARDYGLVGWQGRINNQPARSAFGELVSGPVRFPREVLAWWSLPDSRTLLAPLPPADPTVIHDHPGKPPSSAQPDADNDDDQARIGLATAWLDADAIQAQIRLHQHSADLHTELAATARQLADILQTALDTINQ